MRNTYLLNIQYKLDRLKRRRDTEKTMYLAFVLKLRRNNFPRFVEMKKPLSIFCDVKTAPAKNPPK